MELNYEQSRVKTTSGQSAYFCHYFHPDAGKTTITEQLLLFGGAIRQAGTVKGKKTGNFAKSDWMEMRSNAVSLLRVQ